MVQYLIPWQPKYTPEILMLGNGIHRAFESEDWDALLKGMTDGRFSEDEWSHLGNAVPYPLLAVIASGDSLGQKMRGKSTEMCAQVLPEGEKELLSMIPNMGLDAVLTTNYTYEIE